MSGIISQRPQELPIHFLSATPYTKQSLIRPAIGTLLPQKRTYPRICWATKKQKVLGAGAEMGFSHKIAQSSTSYLVSCSVFPIFYGLMFLKKLSLKGVSIYDHDYRCCPNKTLPLVAQRRTRPHPRPSLDGVGYRRSRRAESLA